MEPMNERSDEGQPKGTAAPAAKAKPEAEKKDHLVFAQAKGHVPAKGPIRHRGGIHRGPHIDVVRVNAGWAIGKVVTEAEYDAAVVAAYSVGIGEGLSEQAAKLAAANERAAKAQKKGGSK